MSSESFLYVSLCQLELYGFGQEVKDGRGKWIRVQDSYIRLSATTSVTPYHFIVEVLV